MKAVTTEPDMKSPEEMNADIIEVMKPIQAELSRRWGQNVAVSLMVEYEREGEFAVAWVQSPGSTRLSVVGDVFHSSKTRTDN